MDISFIILTWNSASDIERCMTSIAKAMSKKQLSYQAIIIDNGSNDGTPEILNSLCKADTNITPIFLDRNTGTTYSRNLGLRRAAGDYIVVMDSDMKVHTDTFDYLIQTIESDHTIGIVAPKLVYGNGKLQKSTDEFPTLFRKIVRYFFLRRIEQTAQLQDQSDRPQVVDYAISAFWMFKKELLDQVGLLDENFFYAPEDVDFCLRVWKAQLKIMYVPKAVAIHYAQEISRGFKFNKAFWEHLKGLVYYFFKHRYFWFRPRYSSRN